MIFTSPALCSDNSVKFSTTSKSLYPSGFATARVLRSINPSDNRACALWFVVGQSPLQILHARQWRCRCATGRRGNGRSQQELGSAGRRICVLRLGFGSFVVIVPSHQDFA